jgi:hypothetical protein
MNLMNAIDSHNDIPADVMADAVLVARCVAAGQPVPSEVARRVHVRAERIRKEVLSNHGILDIGVPAIRELRDEDE